MDGEIVVDRIAVSCDEYITQMNLTVAAVVACISFMAAGFILGILVGGRCPECREVLEREKRMKN